MNRNTQRPQPSRGMSGCAIAALVVLGFGVLFGGGCLAIVLFAGHLSRGGSRVTDSDWDAQMASLAASARVGCDAGDARPLDDISFVEQCHDELKKLVYPDELTFPSRGESVSSPDRCLRELDVLISRKRASGTTTREVAVCTYDPRTRLVKFHIAN